ncbi:glutamate racemase [Thermocrinis albus DSM 14484]|uniref:Glutamate racemase n=1 Tax=Thermocrinis albus (strain DSM 14484 / JCM 11386 / HI 11/12) TaxID=638303 RepID=D3SMI3_THEAH|nr:glutamate racemase [Thermocrinis albus]ADC89963.1 glutamate racemase [Thermocrinis albus DSM 14484]
MKIGVFDSGIGGLTVLKAIRERYPKVDLLYLGDTARVPYGSKSKETVQRYSIECAEFLLGHDVDLVVVACNTASAYALDLLRERLPVEVFGVIEPGVEEALRVCTSGKVGVIGTRGTISSGAYQNLLQKKGVKVLAKACPLFVPLVEEGMVRGPVAELLVEHYLKDLKESGIDTLILGCTHYPLLKDVIQAYMDGTVIVDSAHATARWIERYVKDEGNSSLSLYFTDDSPIIPNMIRLILGEDHPYEVISTLCRL